MSCSIDFRLIPLDCIMYIQLLFLTGVSFRTDSVSLFTVSKRLNNHDTDHRFYTHDHHAICIRLIYGFNVLSSDQNMSPPDSLQ